jgi:CheY-like chemotaxis protein
MRMRGPDAADHDVHARREAFKGVGMDGPTVLVVDDERLIVYSISGYLTSEGFDVKSTTSPEEALSMIENERFDIVLTDLRMVPVSGTDIIKQLRRSGFEGKIIVMSAYLEEFRQELRELKVNAYLEKPFKLSELLRVISA